MRKRLCYEVPAFKIKLEQSGIDRFTVTYWLQVETGLSYAVAAKQLGEAIMHALSCDGKVDNRERGMRGRGPLTAVSVSRTEGKIR